MNRRRALRFGVASRIWGVLLEALCIGVAGAAFALVANSLSPRGLPLTRRPSWAAAQPRPGNGRVTAPSAGGVAAGVSTDRAGMGLAARLEARGLTLVTSNQVQELFRDPRRDAELVVFVDARDAQQYEAAHIPGAYLLDPYRPEHGLASVLAVCATAEQIVLYCLGGDCEDSELAAALLVNSGVPASKVMVYGGGLAEWAANGLPVEIQERRSGQMRTVVP